MNAQAFIKLVAISGISIWSGCRQFERELPFYNSPDFTPVWIPFNQSPDTRITHRVGDFRFTDQDNRTITHETVKGKIHVANFMFTSCGSICPRMTNNLLGLQQEFIKNDDVVLLSYSVTPWQDSVAKLKKYADRYGIATSKWHLLTGNASALYQLARNDYFAEEETGVQKDSTNFLHTEHFLLVDRNGYLRGVYNGTLQLETDRLKSDIHALLEEQ